ncbi:hypothetical protein PMAYCL1PPCAC_06002, partial [Pristionchus mayeri]
QARMAAKKYFDVMKMFLQMEKGSKNYSSIVNTVDERMTNHFGTLHGGCSATMVDVITTGALVATPRGMPGRISEMAARVAALRLAAAASRPSDAVNPEHYRRMIRFFEMDSQDRNVTGIVRSARLTNVEQNRLSAEFVVTPCKVRISVDVRFLIFDLCRSTTSGLCLADARRRW